MWSVQVGHDRPAEGERVLVVERLVVGDAGAAGVDFGTAEFLGRDVLAGRGLHERRAAEEDRPRAADDDRLVAHRRHVGAAGGTRTHDEGDLRDPRRRHPGLVVEDPAEVVAVREDVRLERQERTAAVDEIDAWQPVLEGDLLGAEVLLDGHRVVRAALDRRVVGDDDTGRALDAADAGDDPGAGRIVVVQAAWRRADSARGTALPGRSGDRSVRGRAACRALDAVRWSGRRPRRPVRRSSAWRARRSATSAAIASWLARLSGVPGSRRLRRTAMAARIARRRTRSAHP